MPLPRTCLYPPAWLENERRALEQALRRQGLFKTGAAAHWASGSLDRRIRSYGTFLFFADSRGELMDGVGPAKRASGVLLEEFIEDLTDRVAPVTVAITLAGIAAILRIIDPEGDRTGVMAAARYLAQHAKLVRDIRSILVGASQLYHAGIDRMDRVCKEAATDRRAAMTFQDGLMIAMTTAHPVRLRNLQSTCIGLHLNPTTTGSYRWRFEKSETKNHKVIDGELPISLTSYIERWLDTVRPCLLGSDRQDAMWVASHGDPMSRNTVYHRLCNATEEELGVRIYPHAIRHIAATSIAVSMPENVRMIPFILNNDDRTAQVHYNLADQLSASYQYLQRLEVRRQQAMATLKTRR